MDVFEHPSLMGMEALNILSDGEYNITSTIDCPGFKLYKKDGTMYDYVEHLKTSKSVTAKDCHSTMQEFTKKILKPIMTDFAEKLQKLEKEYALYLLPLIPERVGCVCLHNNLGLRILKKYNMQTLQTELSIDIALIEKG